MTAKKLYALLSSRCSCRAFKRRKIPDVLVNQLLEAACLTPSAGGFQQYAIVKVTEEGVLSDLAELCRRQKFISTAPLSLMFCVDFRRIKAVQQFETFDYSVEKNQKWYQLAVVDAAISAHTVCLLAESMGLASVYVGNVLDSIESVSKLLKLPQYVVPAIMLTVGYPERRGKCAPKHGREVLVHDDFYRELPPQKIYAHYRQKYAAWQGKVPPYTYWFNHYYDLEARGWDIRQQGFFYE